jgi:hypothetical protein
MKSIITDLSFKSLFAKWSNPRATEKGKPGKTSVVLAAPVYSSVPKPEPPALVSRKLNIMDDTGTTGAI